MKNFIYETLCTYIQLETLNVLFFKIIFNTLTYFKWLKYCKYGVKLCSINQSIKKR